MTDLFQEPEDATPLEPQGREGLLQTWITHRRDLNEAEEENIVEGAVWTRSRRRLRLERMLSEDFMRTLHRQMFGDVCGGPARSAPQSATSAFRLIASKLSSRACWMTFDIGLSTRHFRRMR